MNPGVEHPCSTTFLINTLPRDLQIRLIGMVGRDARMALGVRPGKLKIPTRFIQHDYERPDATINSSQPFLRLLVPVAIKVVRSYLFSELILETRKTPGVRADYSARFAYHPDHVWRKQFIFSFHGKSVTHWYLEEETNTWRELW